MFSVGEMECMVGIQLLDAFGYTAADLLHIIKPLKWISGFGQMLFL